MPKIEMYAGAALLSGCLIVSAVSSAGDVEIDLSRTPIPVSEVRRSAATGRRPDRAGARINEVGELSPGIELPTGAVWQPALWVYGSTRVSMLTTDGNRRTLPRGDTAELAVRVDLFANLQLSGTERLFAHVRPLDEDGSFTGQTFSPDSSDFETSFDLDVESWFFEGDIGEIFPRLDPQDRGEGDLGFAFGRIPIEFQNGYLVNDEMNAVGLSKTNIQLPGSSGLRMMAVYAFNHINEPNGMSDHGDVDLIGVFTEGDFPWGLLEFDVAGTVSDQSRGDQINTGLGWTGHFGGSNYSLHANLSRHDPQAVRTRFDEYDGELLVAGYSTEISPKHDIFYANAYWAHGNFGRLASKSGGPPPLGPIGLSYAGVGIGSYRPALWPRPLDSVGFAAGVQKFFASEAGNVALELAHRNDLEPGDQFGETGGWALTLRLQRKFANRFLFQTDAYYALHDGDHRKPQDGENDDDSAALRFELKMNF